MLIRIRSSHLGPKLCLHLWHWRGNWSGTTSWPTSPLTAWKQSGLNASCTCCLTSSECRALQCSASAPVQVDHALVALELFMCVIQHLRRCADAPEMALLNSDCEIIFAMRCGQSTKGRSASPSTTSAVCDCFVSPSTSVLRCCRMASSYVAQSPRCVTLPVL